MVGEGPGQGRAAEGGGPSSCLGEVLALGPAGLIPNHPPCSQRHVISYGISLHAQPLPLLFQHSVPLMPSQGQAFGMWKVLRFLWVSTLALANPKAENWHLEAGEQRDGGYGCHTAI